MYIWLRLSLIMPLVVMLSGCATSRYIPIDKVTKLDVAYTDARWTGKGVPDVGICARDGGEGMSPPLVVRNIPSGTTDIIVEFSDRSFAAMDRGGHGSIRVPVAGQTEIMIPSIAGATFNLPKGVFTEAAHLSRLMAAGAYAGPCSEGGGHFYQADVKAVSKSSTPSQPSRLLGKGSIILGTH